MKESHNLNLLIILLFGYVLLLYSPVLSGVIKFEIPLIGVTSVYYFIFAVFMKRKNFLSFLAITLLFISFFFPFIHYKAIGLHEIYLSWSSDIFAIKLFYSLIIPFVFISFTADFYALPKELSKYNNRRWLFFLVPVLIKRELIFKRYNQIMLALEAKGINTKSIFGRYASIHMWIIPLIITTLFEGVESYEYNKMLKTNILRYSTNSREYIISNKQKFLLLLAFIAVLIRFLI